MTRAGDDVRKTVRQAFTNVTPDAGSGNAPDTIPHQEAVDFFRKKLVTMSPQNFHYFLPRVLIELVHSHASDPESDEHSGLVLELLDVECDQDGYDFELREFGEEAARYAKTADRQCHEIRENLFKDFTQEQSKAIVEWLVLAQTWKDFHRFSNTLQQALSYWRRRAG